ncbi:MAG: hypothetical protein GKR95_20020 [Gammaproteobacteria bacterium]|nr:hypothetical protein [Gammaproteobacteria bacterium]
MSGDSSNHEVGIAITDAIASKGRMGQQNGLEKQHGWSINYLNERTIAMAVIFCLVLVGTIWISPVPLLIKYGVLGLVLVVLIAGGVAWSKRKAALIKLREQHVANFKKATN